MQRLLKNVTFPSVHKMKNEVMFNCREEMILLRNEQQVYFIRCIFCVCSMGLAFTIARYINQYLCDAKRKRNPPIVFRTGRSMHEQFLCSFKCILCITLSHHCFCIHWPVEEQIFTCKNP